MKFRPNEGCQGQEEGTGRNENYIGMGEGIKIMSLSMLPPLITLQ